MKDWRTSARDLYDGAFRPMFVDGAWRQAQSGEVIEARNPADGSLLATVPKGGSADIDAAVAAARKAFDGPWSKFTPFERQALLLRIADRFEAEWETLCLSDTLDMGMPIQRTLANSRRVLGMLRFYAGQAVTIHGQTIPNSFPGEIYSSTVREPIGVVGAIIPWNAPIAGSIWKIAPALATGCTVVLKPSEEASLTVLMIARIMQEAGLPDGVLNVVTGLGTEAGAALAAHPDVDKIVFTGSTATGPGHRACSDREPQAGLAGTWWKISGHRLQRRRYRKGGSRRGNGGLCQFGADLHRRVAAVRGPRDPRRVRAAGGRLCRPLCGSATASTPTPISARSFRPVRPSGSPVISMPERAKGPRF